MSLRVLLVLFLLLDTVSAVRKRRSLIGLEQVIKCATQSRAVVVVLEKYNCYGCYCGFGGEGQVVDEIDRCCFNHDDCYAKALSKTGPCVAILGEVYVDPYNFDCVEENDPVNKTTQFTPVCRSALTKCGRVSCECDAEFAKCLRRFEIKDKKQCPSKRRVCVDVFKRP